MLVRILVRTCLVSFMVCEEQLKLIIKVGFEFMLIVGLGLLACVAVM